MDSKIVTGFDLSEKISALTRDKSAFVISDSNVAITYGSLFSDAAHYIIPAGEDSKTLEYYGKAARAMLEAGCNRSSTVIAVGGGVVGDLAGFTAATYMRGVRWINVPTTLLSQVDSSVGGKTAVDLKDYKNILGAFHMPAEVYISTHFLYTLPEREWICGVGEIVKTAFLSKKVHALLDGSLDNLLDRDDSVVSECVKECIAYKRDVVSRDFYESGPRKALNLGHTVGHALEKVDNHKSSHGEYVLMGLKAEAFILRDRLSSQMFEEINAWTDRCRVTVPDFDPENVAKACMKDKKNGGGRISVMLADYENTREIKLSYEEMVRGLMLWKLSL